MNFENFVRQNSDENKICTVVSSDRNTTGIMIIVLQANEFQNVPRISRNATTPYEQFFTENISLFSFSREKV